jgi:hypothetical protein
MATLPTLRPNGEGTHSGFVDEGGTSLTFAGTWSGKIDDDPDSANDADYISSPNAADGHVFVLLTDMPSDFATLDSLTVTVRNRRINFVNDSFVIAAQIFESDEATALSNEVNTPAVSSSSFTTQVATTITGLLNTSDKTKWDGARLRIRVDWSSNMGADSGIHVDFSAIELNGTYTQGSLDQGRTLTGIASEEAFGSLTVFNSLQIVSLTGIASEEAIGSLTATPGAVERTLTGIASEEAIGTLTIALVYTLSLTGIASEEAFGTTSVTPGTLTFSVSGIASEEAIGTVTVSSGGQQVSLTGIASEEAIGTLSIATPYSLSLTGVASEEAIGTLTLTTTVSRSLTGIASEEAIGTAVFTAIYNLDFTGIASEEAIGTLTLATPYNLLLTGNASEEAIGSITVTQPGPAVEGTAYRPLLGAGQ